MLKKKTPSFEDRLGAAHAQADAAVSVVETIASDLESAAAEKGQIAVEINEEIGRLYDLIANLADLHAEASEAEVANLAKADKIRALVSA